MLSPSRSARALCAAAATSLLLLVASPAAHAAPIPTMTIGSSGFAGTDTIQTLSDPATRVGQDFVVPDGVTRLRSVALYARSGSDSHRLRLYRANPDGSKYGPSLAFADPIDDGSLLSPIALDADALLVSPGERFVAEIAIGASGGAVSMAAYSASEAYVGGSILTTSADGTVSRQPGDLRFSVRFSDPSGRLPLTMTTANPDFGTQVAGTFSDRKTVTVTNPAPETQGVAHAAFTGPDANDFQLVNECFRLQSGLQTAAGLVQGESCPIYVRFAPDGPGASAVRSAVLVIKTSDGIRTELPLTGTSVLGTGGGGPAGPTGPTGPQGPIGPSGPAGTDGQTGPKGDKGDTGANGQNGQKGDTGATGQSGANGQKGDAGQNGARGETGSNGPLGPLGPAGPSGPAGPAGAPGTVQVTVGSGSAKARSIRRGGSFALKIAVKNATAAPFGGARATVSLPPALRSASRAKTASFGTINVGSNGTKTLTIKTGKHARKGTYRLTVKVQIGNETVTQRVTITIR